MPRKPLTERRDPTLPAAGVGWFLTRPGCPTASAGFGAALQGPGTANCGHTASPDSRSLNDRCTRKPAGRPTLTNRPYVELHIRPIM